MRLSPWAEYYAFTRCGAKTLWLDEAFSVWVANHRLLDIFPWLIRIDHHPPLYYVTLHFWQSLFGDLQGPVRALSALCSTLAIPVFYVATRRLFEPPTALIAALILAVSPFQVRFAQEARMYALLTLAVAGALYFTARLLSEEPAQSRRSTWIGLGVCQAAAMLSHNTATVFVPLSLNLTVLGIFAFQRKGRLTTSFVGLADPHFLRRWLAGQTVAFLLWLPWAVPFVIQARVVDHEFWIQPPTLGTVIDTFHNFNLAFLPGWLYLLSIWDLMFWLLALWGVFALRRSPDRAALLVGLFLIPIIGELLVSVRRPIFYDRTLIYTTLPYYLLVAVGIRSLATAQGSEERQRRGRYAAIAATGAIVLLCVVALTAYFGYFQKEEWDKAAAHIAQEVQPGDLVLFNATWVQIPFEYYFRHFDTGAELRGVPVDLFDRGVLEPKMAEGDVPYLAELIDGRKQVWLVYSHDWYTDPQQIIPRELGSRLHLVEQTPFEGLQVMRYQVQSRSSRSNTNDSCVPWIGQVCAITGFLPCDILVYCQHLHLCTCHAGPAYVKRPGRMPNGRREQNDSG